MKFKHYLNDGAEGSKTEEEKKAETDHATVLVNEHIEKLFACYLRLPELSTHEIAEITRKLVGSGSPLTPRTSDRLPAEVDSPEPADPAAELQEPAPSLQLEDSPPEIGIGVGSEVLYETVGSVTFGDDEREALNTFIPRMTSEEMERHWGPRAIRVFILKYQLCRMLLRKLDIEFDPEGLLNTLASAVADEPEESSFGKVVKQVA